MEFRFVAADIEILLNRVFCPRKDAVMVADVSAEGGDESSEAADLEADLVFLAALFEEQMPESWLGRETLEASRLLAIRNTADILNGLINL